YDEKTHERELYNERLLEDMDEALATNQFKVFYQPKYDITGEKPVLSSAEALVRWIHPELGFISPGDFIPVFEEHGLINKLDLYVWREAAAQIRRWRNKYGMTVPVSVNVSRIDLQTADFEGEIIGIVKENDISFSDLLLEITESAYTENEESIVKTVAQLRETGFKIEMDDFGSGYSSLNMLTAMPIDALKLDMRFVRHLTADSKDIRMVQLMVDIAGFLSVPVISEGVETEEQVQLLRECGCDIVQGYYFSKPVPAGDFEKFITSEKE
ncbi:MAG: EAL domain-containing protein, partial [Clostridia bacterium]|nr:EAL domain-containing protein [Clostridia bacterium]